MPLMNPGFNQVFWQVLSIMHRRVKVPWKIGRRCLAFGKKKNQMRRNKVKTERKFKKKCCDCSEVETSSRGKKRGFSMVFGEEENSDDNDEEENQETGNSNARFEAEKVWLELYQVGHLGFGRVSFTDT
ncbi:hypothetical protein F3Y22_tig00112287pilonHSYRG00019 [Hibiscus syriacus]|uniref:Uncharacterized protein n=1 Tax=Hibiscus syriacus TaxID=106335 RepID=A0A6A2XP46_HIBSY|nr:hypothetical protein F3Y22_tig00112287pilonHSYRG00019 [Hibiscus syriacus]